MIFIHPPPVLYGDSSHSGLGQGTDDRVSGNFLRTSFTVPNEVPPARAMTKSPLHRNETAEKTVISMDVSGFNAEHLNIEIDRHVLSVSGKRTNRLGDIFEFCRRFTLKPGTYNEDSINADLTDGVLDLTVHKRPVLKSRKIPISVIAPLNIYVETPRVSVEGEEVLSDSCSAKAKSANSFQVSVETVDEGAEDGALLWASSEISGANEWEEVAHS